MLTDDCDQAFYRCLVADAVVNGVPPQGSLGDEAVEAIAGYGIAVAPVKIGHRSALVRSLTDGLTAIEYEPKGKAAKEINALEKWTCTQVKVKKIEIEYTHSHTNNKNKFIDKLPFKVLDLTTDEILVSPAIGKSKVGVYLEELYRMYSSPK